MPGLGLGVTSGGDRKSSRLRFAQDGIYCFVAEIHTQTVVTGNANMLPGIDLRNDSEIGIAPINVPMNETTSAPECYGIAPGKPGALSEHPGAFVVSFIRTFQFPGHFSKQFRAKYLHSQ